MNKKTGLIIYNNLTIYILNGKIFWFFLKQVEYNTL